jgi:predicted dehydrogenase
MGDEMSGFAGGIKSMNWGVLGCGVIGERRTAKLPEGVRVTACFDVNQERAQALAKKLGAETKPTLEAFFATPGLEAVVIAAINSELVPLAQKALDHGLHILVEKPAARSVTELKTLKNPKGKVIKIGFNHRFHPAYERMLQELASQPNDPIMFIRAQYGNGSRLGFEREWRATPELGGGGELLDQGVHVLDLASGIVPDLKVVTGFVKTHYWNMAVDDNAWATLSSPSTQATFTMHVSSTEWKNEFRFEVYTRSRKYQWLGLGRSYGAEKLFIHKMKPEMGPPDSEEIAFPPEDNSWIDENKNFVDAINGEAKINGGFDDAVRSLAQVEAIYRSSRATQGMTNHPRWWGDQNQ